MFVLCLLAVAVTQVVCDGVVVPSVGFAAISSGFTQSNSTISLQMQNRVTAFSAISLDDSNVAQMVQILTPQLGTVSVVNLPLTPPPRGFATLFPPPAATSSGMCA